MKDFEIKDGELIGYHGKEQNIIIPDGVKMLANKLFSECNILTSVMIPESVEYIGSFAFFKCENLRSVTIRNNSVWIGDGAFYACPKLNSVNCCGISFHPQEADDSMTERILHMLARKEYDLTIPKERKYPVLWEVYCACPEQKEISDYINQNLPEMLLFLIENENHENAEILQKILNLETLVTEKNINELIQYAIDHHKYQMQLILTEYKKDKAWYQEIDDKFKL